MTPISEGDLMALESQWVELDAAYWKALEAANGSGDVPPPNHDGTGDER